MIRWTGLGNYLNRPIRIAAIPGLDASFLGDHLSSSMVMIILKGDAGNNTPARDEFLKSLLSYHPLTICFAGEDAKRNWNLLMDFRASSKALDEGPLTIMSFAEEKTLPEALEGFFWGVSPAEERFDDWKNYSILVEDPAVIFPVRAALKRFCS